MLNNQVPCSGPVAVMPCICGNVGTVLGFALSVSGSADGPCICADVRLSFHI